MAKTAIVHGADWFSNEWAYEYQVQREVDGAWEMVSKFKNPSGNISLSKADAEDSEAYQYKGMVYGEYYRVRNDGNCYLPPVEMYRDFDFTTVYGRQTISFDAY